MKICILLGLTHPFTGRDFHERFVGGTQAALVILAEGFVALGHDVVIATPGTHDETVNGVRYRGADEMTEREFDLALLVRDWMPLAGELRATRRMLLLTDVDHANRPTLAPCLDWAQRVLLMSRYQDERLVELVGEPYRAAARTVVGLPIHTDDYDGDGFETDRENILLYCSVPDRGLIHLRRIFPAIRRRVPDARLIVTSDFTLWGLRSRRDEWQKLLRRVKGAEYVGAVDRPELVVLQKRAKLLAYPCHFIEGFCLSAAECLVSGAVPVTTNGYALTETVGDRGVLIDGEPKTFRYRRRFMKSSVELLQDHDRWLAMATRARADGLERFAPRTVCARFLAIADELGGPA